MKTILTLLFALCMLTASAQYSRNKREPRGKSNYGTGLVVGGLGMLTLSLTTTPIYDWKSSNGTYNPNAIPTNSTGTYTRQPFIRQGARSFGIVTGVTLTLTGVITMLAGN